jgi:hypothetical protein
MTATSEMNRPTHEKRTTPTNSEVSERLAGTADFSVETRGNEMGEKMRAAFGITGSLEKTGRMTPARKNVFAAHAKVQRVAQG